MQVLRNQRMRDSLRSLIDNQPGMEVVGEADNVSKALRFALKSKPDIVLMDINMAGFRVPDDVAAGPGSQPAHRLQRQCPFCNACRADHAHPHPRYRGLTKDD